MTPRPVALRFLVACVAALVVAGCTTAPPVRRSPEPVAKPPPGIAPATPAKKGGGYYLDDGPGDNPPPNLDQLPDAVPRLEKLASGANRPYNVFGVDYVPDLSGAAYKQRGTGSWYGRKFHGQRTSSGEVYDMYAMTAAHPTLPIPCYALVTNVQNGRSVIVRVNDRGPFLHNRIMDLSYAAASKVGYLSSGSGQIEVELLLPADIAAGRIPMTTNSVLVAAAKGSTPLPIAMVTAPRAGDNAASPPAASDDRGIPLDLLPDPQPPARLPETATASGFYLQLGAFRVRAGADSFAAHVARELDPGVATKLQVTDQNGLYRVRIGPYPRRAEADLAAADLRAAVSQPIVVMPDSIER